MKDAPFNHKKLTKKISFYSNSTRIILLNLNATEKKD